MVSVVIATLNEEKKIRNCLESVKWADEIVVMDSCSNDRTVEIAKEYTDKVYQQEYLGGGPMRNLAIRKCTCDWVFTIDADERVSPELADEIREVLNSPQYEGYYVPRKTYFLNKWIRHSGWWPDYVLRLFRKVQGQYDAHLAHAKVHVTGKTQKLKNPLIHLTCTSLSEYIARINSRTSLVVQEDHPPVSILTPFLHSLARFLRIYFIRGGILDGAEGLILAALGSYYVLLKYLKVWEKQRLSK